MIEFCIGLAIFILVSHFVRGGITVKGPTGLALFGCAAWGLGKLVLLMVGK